VAQAAQFVMIMTLLCRVSEWRSNLFLTRENPAKPDLRRDLNVRQRPAAHAAAAQRSRDHI
jgi:hypothetical protein